MNTVTETIDFRARNHIVKGWTLPTTTVKNETAIPKPVDKYTDKELQGSDFSSKALDVIVNGVDMHQHQLISTYKIAKEAWDILAETHEGDNAVKCFKLQQLNLKILEYMIMRKLLILINGKLAKISNNLMLLGKRFLEKKLVRKVSPEIYRI